MAVACDESSSNSYQQSCWIIFLPLEKNIRFCSFFKIDTVPVFKWSLVGINQRMRSFQRNNLKDIHMNIVNGKHLRSCYLYQCKYPPGADMLGRTNARDNRKIIYFVHFWKKILILEHFCKFPIQDVQLLPLDSYII